MNIPHFDPKRDLMIERTVDLAPELIWRAWTHPEDLKVWFCPRPWSVVDCEIDLRPGGAFSTVMCSPEGERMPAEPGCYLEVVENRRLIWTSALGPGYRPLTMPEDALSFTGCILLEPRGNATHYTAIAIHPDEASKDRHAAMGFHEGWNIALDQLIEHMQAVG